MNRRIVSCLVFVGALPIFAASDTAEQRAIAGRAGDSPAKQMVGLCEKLQKAITLVETVEKELTDVQPRKKVPGGNIDAGTFVVKLRKEEGKQDRYVKFVILLRAEDEKQKEVAALVMGNQFALKNVVSARVSQMAQRDLSDGGSQEKLRDVVKTVFDEVLFAGRDASRIKQITIEGFTIQ